MRHRGHKIAPLKDAVALGIELETKKPDPVTKIGSDSEPTIHFLPERRKNQIRQQDLKNTIPNKQKKIPFPKGIPESASEKWIKISGNMRKQNS